MLTWNWLPAGRASSGWLAVWLGWIPFFKVDGLDPSDPTATQSVFTAGTFIAEVIAPTNAIGDEMGTQLQPDGTMVTPDGFK